jgi:hypothetical protein
MLPEAPPSPSEEAETPEESDVIPQPSDSLFHKYYSENGEEEEAWEAPLTYDRAPEMPGEEVVILEGAAARAAARQGTSARDACLPEFMCLCELEAF